MDDRDEPGWSRSEWARWWIDHDEIDEAARMLDPGDVLPLGKADFLDLAAALGRRGLTALYEDGAAFVYTAAQAQHLQAEAGIDSAVAGLGAFAGGPIERKPPARSPAPPATRAKQTA